MEVKDSPLFKIVVLFSVGIVAGKFIPFTLSSILILISALLLSAILLYKLKFFVAGNLLMSLVIVLLGYSSFRLHEENLSGYPLPKTQITKARVYGTIVNIELPRERSETFLMNIDSLKERNINYRMNIQAIVKLYEGKKEIEKFTDSFSSGNYIKISGKFFKPRDRRNPGEFDYRAYLREKGISAQISLYKLKDIVKLSSNVNHVKTLIFNLRLKIEELIGKLYSGEKKHLIDALILGERKDLNKNIVKDFINAGIVHVLAVSGLHVGFIVAIFFLLFGRFNLFLKGGITIFGILMFMLISGVHPSVVRASIMAVLLILAFLTGRAYSSFNALALAAFILLIFNPAELFSPGFQLSFAAVFSILYFYPRIEKLFNLSAIKNKSVLYLLKMFLLTFSAQLGTLPITMIYFKKISLISFVINIVIIPLIGIIVALAVASLFFGVFSLYLGTLYATTNSLLIDLMFYLAKVSSGTSFSYLDVNSFGLSDAILYFILLGISFYAFTKFINRKAKVLVLFLSVILFFIYSRIISPPFFRIGKLYVIAIDIGQGDSFLVRFPNNKTALIDAGNATKHFDNGTAVIEPLLKYLGISKINYLLISHIDADHYRGSLSLIKDGFVDTVYKPCLNRRVLKDVRFEKFVRSNNITIKYYQREKIMIGNSLLYILNDTTIANYNSFTQNNKSGLLKLCYGDVSFLFTGDLEKSGEKIWSNLYGNFLHSSLLKVGHHGSKSSTSELFLNFVKPKFALISAGENNKFGHPNFETIRILQKHHINIKRTDQSGAIVVCSDGETIKFIDWKN